MKLSAMKYAMMAAAAAMALGGLGPAAAQNDGRTAKTPPNFPYDIVNGRRVPKSKRVANADGSWTEQVRQGKCTVTRVGRPGEMREESKCD